MSAKPILEATAKTILNKCLEQGVTVKSKFAIVNSSTDWTTITQENPWLLSEVSATITVISGFVLNSELF